MTKHLIRTRCQPRRSDRLRQKVLWGLLLVSATTFVCYFPLTDIGADPEPSYLERAWFKADGARPPREPDVVFIPTPQTAVDRMLELAELKPDDVLYDLGCGDGRFVVTAAKKYGVRAVGMDINPLRVAQSRRNAKTNGVTRLVQFVQADIFEADFSEATVVTLYLLPELNVRLMPKLAQLRPGTRIFSFEFNMRGAKPVTVSEIRPEGRAEPYRIFKWVVPWESE